MMIDWNTLSGKVKWTKPEGIDEHDEVATQMLDTPNRNMMHAPEDVRKYMGHLINVDNYKEALANGRVKKIKPEKCVGILNHTSEPGSYQKLNSEKRVRTEERFAKGKV